MKKHAKLSGLYTGKGLCHKKVLKATPREWEKERGEGGGEGKWGTYRTAHTHKTDKHTKVPNNEKITKEHD